MSQLRPSRTASLGRALGAYLLVGTVALLFGRATVYGLLHPFVPALVAGVLRSSPLAAGVAAVVGLFSLQRTWGTTPALGAGTSLIAFAFWAYSARRKSVPGWAIAASLGLASTAGPALWAALQAQGPEAYWLALFQGLFAAALVQAYRPALARFDTPERRQSGALTLAAEASDARFGAVALLASTVAGLDGLSLGFVLPTTILGAGLVATLGLRRGAGAAAAAGALFAAVATLSRGIVVSDVGALALAGLLAGAMRGLGGPGAALGATLGFLAANYTSAPAHTLGAILASALAGGVAGTLVPAPWWGALVDGTGLENLARGGMASEERGVASQPERGAQKLKALGKLFEELSHAFTEPTPAAPAMVGAAGAAAPPVGAVGHDLAPVMEAVASRVCQGCDLQRTCWHGEFYRTYRNLGEVWATAEQQGGTTPGRFPEDFRRQCIHPADMAAAVNQVLDLVRLSRYWERRTREGRDLVAAQLAGVAQIMEGLAEAERPAGAAAGQARPRMPVMAYQLGVSRASKGGASVSGDTLLHRRLETSRLVLALSDGMGAGPRAAQESQVTVDLLDRLLEAGFAPEVAIRTINSALLLRSADEVFATLDLLLLNLTNGEADFLKTGAAPSFVRRGGQVSVVKSASLPAGILTQIEVPLVRRSLHPGDLLVMVTDGLLADLEEGRVIEFLRRFPRQEPQLVTEALLGLALEDREGRPTDDITVAAVLVTPAGESEPKPATGWAAVKWRPASDDRREGVGGQRP